DGGGDLAPPGSRVEKMPRSEPISPKKSMSAARNQEPCEISGLGVKDCVKSEAEKAAEEGCTLYCSPAIAVLLPQTTWEGFRDKKPQKTATVVHEITHVENDLLNGNPTERGIVLTVWAEFFSETVACLFYDPSERLNDLRLGMDYAATRQIDEHSGLAQLGRLLGFLNGCSSDLGAVRALFARYGHFWQGCRSRCLSRSDGESGGGQKAKL
ncbi:MAG: hypothetical protein ACLQM8_06990, partial [Limisphaerales bacterium]